jgi:hypothetical protein
MRSAGFAAETLDWPKAAHVDVSKSKKNHAAQPRLIEIGTSASQLHRVYLM